MSDKNLDIDGILDDKDSGLKDFSLTDEPPKKKRADMDEIDELIASLKRDKHPKKPAASLKKEAPAEDEPVIVTPAVPEDVAPVISDAEETEPDANDIKSAEDEIDAVIGADKEDIKKHFGKEDPLADDEEEEEDEEDEDEEEEQKKKAPAKKSPDKNKASSRPASDGPRRSGKKKRRKKRGIGFNGSIFGGIILVTIILTVSMLLAVGGLTVGMEYYGIGQNENEIKFNIPEGSSNEEIADLLIENGVIKNKDLFLMTIKIMKPETIYPGDVTLQPSMPYSEIIEVLEVQRQRYETVTITFTEGEYLIDIAQKLEENKVCSADDFMFTFQKDFGFNFEKYITGNENAFYAREGYFFPDTYDFYVGDTPDNVTRVLREHYNSKINEAMYKKMNDLGLSLNETITLASIVQLEAANVDEMPKVASVFLNRLNDPDTFPMLQTDTTYKYIDQVIKPNAGNDVKAAHYIEYYDTYAIDGLPAGPICNPGMDAILAVLNAEKTNYYYFCNNLETGETFYAETLEEHEKNQIQAGLINAVEEENEDGEGDEEGEEGEGENGEENYEEQYYENY